MRSSASTSNFRRFLELSSPERRLLVEAWWRLLAAAMRWRLAPRRTLAKALVESGPTGRSHPSADTSSAQMALAVSRAGAHHLAVITCLPRSLALQRMLARRGIASRLRIGVRKESNGAGGIVAHAWVEVDGVALGEPEAIAERFLPLVAEKMR